MGQEERHYNINKLNKIFAISSVLLLICLGLMLADDYSREWKDHQREFRAIEIEKTRVKYDNELTELKEQKEYKALLGKIEEAEKTYAAKCSDLGTVEEKIAKLKAENEIIAHDVKITNAKLDAAIYRYEEAQHTKHNLEAATAEFNRLTSQIEALNLKEEQSNARLAAAQKIINDCGKDLKTLNKQKKTLSSKKLILERKLKKIDPNEMTLANMVADQVRDLPILDLSDPKQKIEQIVLKDITDDVNFMQVPRVDRCMTCHQGVTNPDYKNVPQPYTTHPNLELFLSNNSAHPLEEFGCTSCHGGRGRGTDFNSSAHMPSSEHQKKEWEEKYGWKKFHHWETPMFPLKYVEAGCFKCHSSETAIKGAEKLNLGLQLMERTGCYSCHKIEKYQGWIEPGPNLINLSSKINKDWAYRWIRDPKSFRHNTWMPAFFGLYNNRDPESVRRTNQEIHAMVHYLFTTSEDYKLKNMPHRGEAKRGEKIVESVGCYACHNIQKEPDNAPTTRDSLRRQQGPNLIGLGTKTNEVWIYNWLKDPHRYHADTKMPNLRLTDQEAADVAAFLSKDTNDEFNKQPIPKIDETVVDEIVRNFLVKANTAAQTEEKMSSMSLDEKLFFSGKKLIAHYGCFSCHDIKGFETYKPIGTELTEEGSKPVDKLDFGFIHIDHSNYAWFEQKLKQPRIFDEGRVRAHDEKLRMPNFHFTDEEVEAIVTALLGFVKERPADTKLKIKAAEDQFMKEGQALIRQFNCQGCHIIEGEGGTIQSSVIDWLVKYDNRSQNEAEAIVGSFSPPNLIGEGKKVKTKWLFEFLHEPTTIRPWLHVRMPTYKFNVDHLNVLVKYFNALDDQEFPFSDVGKLTVDPEEYKAGEKLFSSDYFSCASCHIVGDKFPEGSPDSWAPNFALAAERLKPQWIEEWMRNPQDLLPGTKMPTFYDPEFFDESGPEDILGGDENTQIKALTNYLLTLTPMETKEEKIKVETPDDTTKEMKVETPKEI